MHLDARKHIILVKERLIPCSTENGKTHCKLGLENYPNSLKQAMNWPKINVDSAWLKPPVTIFFRLYKFITFLNLFIVELFDLLTRVENSNP